MSWTRHAVEFKHVIEFKHAMDYFNGTVHTCRANLMDLDKIVSFYEFFDDYLSQAMSGDFFLAQLDGALVISAENLCQRFSNINQQKKKRKKRKKRKKATFVNISMIVAIVSFVNFCRAMTE